MNSSSRPTTFRSALLALGCALGLALLLVPAVKADDAKAPALPLKVTFEKVTGVVDAPPFVAKLTNTSKDSLKVGIKIRLSVAAHPMAKSKDIAEQAIAAGQTFSIPELAAEDKLTITAAGFAPLDVTVK